jgi:hypothetical protein
MPIRKRGKKWTFGGKADYDTKEEAERSYQAYLAKKHSKKGKK